MKFLTHCCFSVAGAVSDALGRKTAFAAATLCTTVFGFATAAAPNYAVSHHAVSSHKLNDSCFPLTLHLPVQRACDFVPFCAQDMPGVSNVGAVTVDLLDRP